MRPDKRYSRASASVRGEDEDYRGKDGARSRGGADAPMGRGVAEGSALGGMGFKNARGE